jgi:tRNA (cmo5U34)-methyltransferase
MNDGVRDLFNAFAAGYDNRRRKFIPNFDAFYGSGIDFLSCGKAAPKILDMGAGTGLYSAVLLGRYPGAEITLIDLSENMLGLAKERFAGNRKTNYILADYGEHDFGEERFDIVISAMSIHHTDADGKKKIYRKAFALLNKGGEFLNADEIGAENSELDGRYLRMWKDYVRVNTDETDYAQFLKNIQIDIRAPLSQQLEHLRDAGFSDVDFIYRLSCFAVLYGQKL